MTTIWKNQSPRTSNFTQSAGQNPNYGPVPSFDITHGVAAYGGKPPVVLPPAVNQPRTFSQLISAARTTVAQH